MNTVHVEAGPEVVIYHVFAGLGSAKVAPSKRQRTRLVETLPEPGFLGQH